jgi:ribose transport system substrate-binding protein
MSGQIFISYRRDDNPAWARLVHNRLSQHFSQSKIFMDVDTIEPGIDFVEAIEESVGSCDVLIAVIAAHWLSAAAPQGGRRLDNPEDSVRLEIATALRRKIRVIPVLVDGALMPQSDDLPDDLKFLVRRNALQLSHDRFRTDSERLIGAIEGALEKTAAERRQREEKERLETERRETEEQVRLETEQREKERLEAEQRERERHETERRQREEQERLEAAQHQHEEQKRPEAAHPEHGDLQVGRFRHFRLLERRYRKIYLSLVAAGVIVVAAGVIVVIISNFFVRSTVQPVNIVAPTPSMVSLKGVAVTVGDLFNPFFAQLARGAEAQAKKYNPAVKFRAESSHYNVHDQTNQMDDFVSSGVNLILLNAADSKGIVPAVMRAKAAGITVVAVDVRAEGGVDATVTSNNKQAGELDGKYIADRLKGKGQVVIVNGPPLSSLTDRVAGFLEVIKNYPEIKILSQDQNAGGSRDGGLRVMTALLTEFSRIDAVFAINDPTAIGCDLAAKRAEDKKIFIVSVDGAPDVVLSLKDPNSLIAASAAQDPYAMAGKAVEIGYNIINGRKPEQALTLIPVDLITKGNVDQYKGWPK